LLGVLQVEGRGLAEAHGALAEVVLDHAVDGQRFVCVLVNISNTIVPVSGRIE
jgi:hypothetical protein